MKIGLIGAGRIGRLHASNLVGELKNTKLVAVADVFKEAAINLARELNIPKITGDYHELLYDSEIEAVLVCTSTHTHAEIIQAAAAAGKHIFCEKPLALDLSEIDTILAAVKKAGVILQVGFHRRFDPHFRRLRELLSQGVIGKPWLLKITSYDPAPPPISYVRVSGGIFLDMTIHDFDMARFLLGEVEEVYATGSVLVDPEIGAAGDVDTAVVILRFKSGALGVITNCRKAVYGHDQRIEILGEKGALFAENPRPHATYLATEQGYTSAPLHYFFMERYREAYIEEMRAFIEAVREGKSPPVTGWDGKVAVVMGYAAKRSLTEGRLVRLSEIDPTLA
ncbi:MAG: inositol 2-dehydrogenase [Methanomassiliicoccales archaeon]|nr:inositol 2-dehydrogenase [Methanomassiliicoccales archaeon]